MGGGVDGLIVVALLLAVVVTAVLVASEGATGWAVAIAIGLALLILVVGSGSKLLGPVLTGGDSTAATGTAWSSST